ncbi:hypothetical protein PoMZ_04389 [Pyricularia oryzae]|uniref:Uncharacterized protein n=1 Tax=Pyricularia oryzae TaxID=318829 RepID=A0A4P7N9N4_PYROR|nr:hypothetical protein PoMZ_04389 [Pyricularia oryzae]
MGVFFRRSSWYPLSAVKSGAMFLCVGAHADGRKGDCVICLIHAAQALADSLSGSGKRRRNWIDVPGT